MQSPDGLPQFPWNDLIDMTSGGSEQRVLVIALSAIHDAINANTLALRAALHARSPG